MTKRVGSPPGLSAWQRHGAADDRRDLGHLGKLTGKLPRLKHHRPALA